VFFVFNLIMFSNSHQVWAQRIKTEQREAAK